MDYHGNTHKQREAEAAEREPVEKVVEGEVVVRKKGFMQRFKSVFLGGDIRNAARYLGADVILPAIRNLMVDATTRGVERVVYGESVSQRRRPQPGYGSRISYSSYSSVPSRRDRAYLPDQPPRPLARQIRAETNDVILASREDAEVVLERLSDIIDKYVTASVADLNKLIGQPSSHVDQKWGWVDLRGTEIRQIRDGYVLELPPAEEI